MTNGPVEGFNNKLRVIALRAYGFHSHGALISDAVSLLRRHRIGATPAHTCLRRFPNGRCYQSRCDVLRADLIRATESGSNASCQPSGRSLRR